MQVLQGAKTDNPSSCEVLLDESQSRIQTFEEEEFWHPMGQPVRGHSISDLIAI
jgi:hypothetical protein